MLKSLAGILFAAGMLLLQTVRADEARVWIFAGLPGDDEHHQAFEKTLGLMKKGFVTHCGVAPEHCTIYYGPKSAGYAGEGSKENILAALKEIAALSHSSPQTPQWLIFVGHAHAVDGGSMLNLPGPDLSTFDFGRALAEINPATPLNLIFTHTAAFPFLKAASGPGRVIISATSPKDLENETEFPGCLAEVLNDPAADANKDGHLDMVEIFRATHERVLARYQAEKLIVREACLLDGDGDGQGTQRPADKDAIPAAGRFFTLTAEGRGID